MESIQSPKSFDLKHRCLQIQFKPYHTQKEYGYHLSWDFMCHTLSVEEYKEIQKLQVQARDTLRDFFQLQLK